MARLSSALLVTLAGVWFPFVQAGLTLLHVACQNGHEKIVERLKEAGANLEAKTEVSCRCEKAFCPSAGLCIVPSRPLSRVLSSGHCCFLLVKCCYFEVLLLLRSWHPHWSSLQPGLCFSLYRKGLHRFLWLVKTVTRRLWRC